MTPKQELKLITDRLEAAGKGIILFHDTKRQTAAMLPAFLRYLQANHYRVVHLVPAGATTPAGGSKAGIDGSKAGNPVRNQTN